MFGETKQRYVMGMIPSHIDADKLIREAVTETELYEVKEGIREQLRKGIIDPTQEGEAQRQYAPATIKSRRSHGKSTQYVNLDFTGQLYRSIRVKFYGMSLK